MSSDEVLKDVYNDTEGRLSREQMQCEKDKNMQTRTF